MNLTTNSIESTLMKFSKVSLDTCVLSNLARYRDIVVNGSSSWYYGKYDQAFMDEYEKLYESLKNNTGEIIIPLIGQIEIASTYTLFLPIMRVIDELDCKLEPFPSITLIDKLRTYINSNMSLPRGLTAAQAAIIANNINSAKYTSLVNQSAFMRKLIVKYIKELKDVDMDKIYYYQNVASILSLIYRSTNEKGNRMMAVKDMFDAILLAESQIYGANYLLTNNINDFKKSINSTYGDIFDDVENYFENTVAKNVYNNYVKNNISIDHKSVLEYFKNTLKNQYDDFDLLLLSDITKKMIDKTEGDYKKFLKTLSRVIYTQRHELKVSVIKRDNDFLDFLDEITDENCEQKITKLWNDTISIVSGNNSNLVERIYSDQGIHEKHDTLEKQKNREEKIKVLFNVNSKEELIDSLVESLMRYKEDLFKSKNNIEIKLVGVK